LRGRRRGLGGGGRQELRLIFYVSHGVEVARAVRGKKGDVVLRLPSGKIAFPLDFQPQEGEAYLVEVVEERERYARVRLHQHELAASVRPDLECYYVEVRCTKCGRLVYGWNPGLHDWYEERVPEEVKRMIPNLEAIRQHNIAAKERKRRREAIEEEVKRMKMEFIGRLFRPRRGETVINAYETPNYYYIFVRTLREPERRCVGGYLCAKRCVCAKEVEVPGAALFERVDKKTLKSEVVEVPFRYETVWEEEGFTMEPYRKAVYDFGEPARLVALRKDYDTDAVLRAIDAAFARYLAQRIGQASRGLSL